MWCDKTCNIPSYLNWQNLYNAVYLHIHELNMFFLWRSERLQWVTLTTGKKLYFSRFSPQHRNKTVLLAMDHMKVANCWYALRHRQNANMIMYPKSAFERLKDHTQRVWKSLSHCIISHPLHQRLSFEQTAVPISNARNFMASVICSTLKKGVG